MRAVGGSMARSTCAAPRRVSRSVWASTGDASAPARRAARWRRRCAACRRRRASRVVGRHAQMQHGDRRVARRRRLALEQRPHARQRLGGRVRARSSCSCGSRPRSYSSSVRTTRRAVVEDQPPVAASQIGPAAGAHDAHVLPFDERRPLGQRLPAAPQRRQRTSARARGAAPRRAAREWSARHRRGSPAARSSSRESSPACARPAARARARRIPTSRDDAASADCSASTVCACAWSKISPWSPTTTTSVLLDQLQAIERIDDAPEIVVGVGRFGQIGARHRVGRERASPAPSPDRRAAACTASAARRSADAGTTARRGAPR